MSDGDLGGFLRQSRVKVGLSQKDVAIELGYKSSQFVSNWERGLSSPPIGTFRRLCSLYKTSETEMFQKLKSIAIKKLEAELEREFFGDSVQIAKRAEADRASAENSSPESSSKDTESTIS